jgi:hypothetical protein
MRNEKIIQQFINQRDYNLSLNAKNLSIRDGKLYSYNLLIAEHDGFGNIVVYDYMATGARGMVSATTSQHVSLVKRSVPRNLLILE